MSEMIDRIARRLCCPGECRSEMANAAHPERLFPTPCNAITKAADAKAAIEEMLEPTESMKALDASLDSHWDNRTSPSRLVSPLGSHTGASYQAMIREALR